MVQPDAFAKQGKEHLVCRLKKNLLQVETSLQTMVFEI